MEVMLGVQEDQFSSNFSSPSAGLDVLSSDFAVKNPDFFPVDPSKPESFTAADTGNLNEQVDLASSGSRKTATSYQRTAKTNKIILGSQLC